MSGGSPGKWLLGAAPAMLALSRLFPGGEAAALFLWAAAGQILRQGPYARKRRRSLHRLFFACAGAITLFRAFRLPLLLALPGPPSALSSLLIDAGAACLSLIPAPRLLRLPLPRRAAWGLGGLLCLIAWGLSRLA